MKEKDHRDHQQQWQGNRKAKNQNVVKQRPIKNMLYKVVSHKHKNRLKPPTTESADEMANMRQPNVANMAQSVSQLCSAMESSNDSSSTKQRRYERTTITICRYNNCATTTTDRRMDGQMEGSFPKVVHVFRHCRTMGT